SAVNGSGSAASPTLSVTAGTLTGSSTITVTGATTWSGGTMSGAGATNLLGSSTLSGTFVLDTRTLNNAGAVTDTVFRSAFNGAEIGNQHVCTPDTLGSPSLNGAGTFNN